MSTNVATKAQIKLLSEAAETNDPAKLKEALRKVIKTMNVSQIARDVGIPRQSVYNAISENGNPAFSTLVSIMSAIGVKTSFKVAA